MNKILAIITIKKSDGSRPAFQMNTAWTLAETRGFLMEEQVMRAGEQFLLSSGAHIGTNQEGSILLSDILDEGVLHIGRPTTTPQLEDDDIARYNRLSDGQKRELFNNIEAFRGIAFRQDGFGKTYKDVCSWAPDYLPAARTPNPMTEVTSNLSFSKSMHELKTFSSHAASLSISAPFASVSSEYKTSKETSNTTTKITEYLVTKFIVRKVNILIDAEELIPTPKFVAAAKVIAADKKYTLEHYYKLITLLNEWGYYIPQEFTLGGAVFGTEETQIEEYAEAVKESQEFKVSFKAEFKQIGGGAAYENASGNETINTNTHKYQNITMRLIGGSPGLEKDYPKWADSLQNALNWSMPDVQRFWPTLLLLANDPEGPRTLNFLITLIERFSGHPNARKQQPYLDMHEYNTQMQVALNPFAIR